MWMLRASCALAFCLAVLGGWSARCAAQVEAVDLHLVLAVDVSWSMDPEEQRLQRDGYVEAFRDTAVIKAIQSGPAGRIAVTYFEWAGADIQFMVVPWMIVTGRDDAHRLADQLAARHIGRHRMTSISSALEHAHRLLENAPGIAARRVVDVSGDGPNNSGVAPVTLVRDALLADGVVINGLPIMLKVGRGGGQGFGFGQDIAELDEYYAQCVTGGPGSFVIPVRTRGEFATATRQKLLQEISWLPVPGVVRVQQLLEAPTPPGDSYDCLVGERNWQRYFLERGRL